MLMRWRYEASETISFGRHWMKRVTPSSKLSAIWKVMSALPRLDVVDVDDVMDVVVLQNHFFLLDERRRTGGVQGVEGRPEIGIDVLVAVVHRQPVEPHLHEVAVLADDLDVRDVVAGGAARGGCCPAPG